MSDDYVEYQVWVKTMSSSITEDSLWKVEAYRLATYAADIGWQDVKRISQDKRVVLLASQLYRALASVGANISEGYSRVSHKEKAHFYEYALGSARESRDWYFKVRHVLGEDVAEQRYSTLNQIIRLLLRMIPNQRSFIAKENHVTYNLEHDEHIE